MTQPILAITGVTGFVGSHLARIAADAGMRVWGIGRDLLPDRELAPHCDEYFSCDLAAGWPLPVDAVDSIVHLAGLAEVGRSFAEPQRYLDVNSAMMTNMAEALLQGTKRPRIVTVSSGAVYATSDGTGGPTDESVKVAASSPYAVAKILVETQAGYYATRGLDMIVARPFNHIGPGQSSGFLVPDLTAAMHQLGPGEPLMVGNLETARDYTDVRDVARAYLTLATAGAHRHDTYNIASGSSIQGRTILGYIAEALGRPVPPLEIDDRRLRPGDPLTITGSAQRLREEFGWAPTIPVQSSIAEFVAS